MRNWTKRAGGTVITALNVALFVYGLPGLTDNRDTWVSWLSWVTDLSIPTFVYPVGMITGILIATSEFWWKKVPRFKGSSRQSTHISTNQSSTDVEQFQACLPQIERCRQLLKPYASPLGGLKLGWEYLNAGGDEIVELVSELNYLAQRLSALRIQCPDVQGVENDSNAAFCGRMQTWSIYLARLVVMIREGDLNQARLIEPIKMPTTRE